MQNHVIDPTYFDDAIEMFAFNFNWYPIKEENIDDLGRKITTFDNKIIRGSLQSQGTKLKQDLKGNTEEMIYQFYCKSLYRIKKGDFILYNKRWLHVDSVFDYDFHGVRSCELRMINLNNYQDFKEHIKYLEGDIII